MATYSNNTTIKYVSGVNATGSNANIYTVPAGHFIIISIVAVGGGQTIQIGAGGDALNVPGQNAYGVYVPEGITLYASGGGRIVGALFTNTP